MSKNEKVRTGWEDKIVTYQNKERLIEREEYYVLKHNLRIFATDQCIFQRLQYCDTVALFTSTKCPPNCTSVTNRYMFPNNGIQKVMLLSDYELMMKEESEDIEIEFGDDPTPRCSPNCSSCNCNKYCTCVNPKTKKVYISNNIGYVDVCRSCGKEIDELPF